MREVIGALLLALGLLGCAPAPDALLLTHWTLHGAPVDLPHHLDVGDRPSDYVLEADVVVPESLRNERLSFVVPHLEALIELRVDGELLQELEPPAPGAYRSSVPHQLVLAPSPAATRHLELLVHHRWSQSAWFDSVPRLEPFGAPDSEVALVRFMNGPVALYSFGGLAQVGLIYLAIFAFDRRRTAYLYFGIQGLGASYNDLFVYGHSQEWFGRIDVALVGILLSTAPISAVYFTHALFGLPRPSRLWLVLLALACACSIVSLNPFLVPMRMLSTIVSIALVMVYQVVLCVRLLRR